MNEVNEPKAQLEAVPSTVGLEVTRRKEMDLFEIVMKLNGCVQPVGETHSDSARFENLERLCELTERLMVEIRQVSHCAERHEASMAAAGKAAQNFIRNIEQGDF